MAQYFVLRNCFVGDRYYAEGRIYDLPIDLEKSPKNFKAVDEAMAPITPAVLVEVAQQAPDPQKDESLVMVEKTFAVQVPGVSVPTVTTTNALDWDNAEVYVSDKDKAKAKKNKKK